MTSQADPDGPRVLGVGSPKGGVGKTQLAVTLADLASRAGYRVLLVDADRLRSSYDWATRSPRMDFDVTLDLDPANLVRLREVRDVDLVVVDLPGAVGEAWTALLRGNERRPVVDVLLIPSLVLVMDLRAVVREIRDAVIPAGVPYLLVGTKVKTPSVPAALHDLNDIAGDGIAVARTIIRDLTAHSEAVAQNRAIAEMPGGRHSTARAAERECRALARETFALLDMKWPAALPDLPNEEGPA